MASNDNHQSHKLFKLKENLMGKRGDSFGHTTEWSSIVRVLIKKSICSLKVITVKLA